MTIETNKQKMSKTEKIIKKRKSIPVTKKIATNDLSTLKLTHVTKNHTTLTHH